MICAPVTGLLTTLTTLCANIILDRMAENKEELRARAGYDPDELWKFPHGNVCFYIPIIGFVPV